MRRLLIIAVIGAVAAVVGITFAAAGGASASNNGRAVVSVKRIAGAGKVLVDSKGRALYRNDQEKGRMVLCGRGCVSFWKPLIVHGKPTAKSVPGKLSVLRRPDGSRQLAYNGKRLYTFALDMRGKVTGDGARDAFNGRAFTWHVVHPVGTKKSSAPPPTTSPNPYPGY